MFSKTFLLKIHAIQGEVDYVVGDGVTVSLPKKYSQTVCSPTTIFDLNKNLYKTLQVTDINFSFEHHVTFRKSI